MLLMKFNSNEMDSLVYKHILCTVLQCMYHVRTMFCLKNVDIFSTVGCALKQVDPTTQVIEVEATVKPKMTNDMFGHVIDLIDISYQHNPNYI